MIISNIFSPEELEIIHADLNQRIEEHWNDWANVRMGMSYPNEQGSISFKYVTPSIKDILRKKIIKIDKTIRGYDFNAYYQIWNIGSGTGLHDDSEYMFNATFYLNKEWSPDYGGLYVYEKNDQYYAYVPKYNSCSYMNQSTSEMHLVTPITIHAKEKRMTIHCKGLPT